MLAQTSVPFTIRYSEKLRGDLTLISNNILNRNEGAGRSSNDPYNGYRTNDVFNMGYIDVDTDASTFSSSKATLDIANSTCLNVKFAGLYWGAIYKEAIREKDYNQVKFKLPGAANYIDIIADDVIFDTQGTFHPDPYACFADVTGYVQSLGSPVGEYTVANVRASLGWSEMYFGGTAPLGGASAGWTLVIVYEDPLISNKNVTIFDGFSGINKDIVNPVDIYVSGFTVIPTGPVKARIGVSCLEGDRGLGGDSYSISSDGNNPVFRVLSDAVNIETNFFNSSISIDGTHVVNKVPNSINNLGWDTDLFEVNNPANSVIGNDETAATLRLQTNKDSYFVFQTSFAIEIIEPKITVIKTVDDGASSLAGANVTLGDSMWYQLRFQNTGNDSATNTTIKDLLPINVDLDESSIILPWGVNYTYIAPTATSGGIIMFTIDDSIVTKGATFYDIRFKVTVTDQCNDLRDACENRIENVAFAYYTGLDSGTQISDDPSFYGLDNCDFGLSGATNFLVDVAGCTFERTEVICGDSLDITAGNGFVAYEWKNAAGIVVGNSKTLTVTNQGVYTVYKTANAPCVDATETVIVVPFGIQKNPLISQDGGGDYKYVDAVKICPNDGRELSEIYLCGTDDYRVIVTNIASANQILWEKLDPLEEGTSDVNCPNTTITSKWTTIDTTNNFTADTAGEYRLRIVYPGGCFSNYYFNVFKSTVQPIIVNKNINCGNDGMITINNIDASLYEFSVVLDGQPAGFFSSVNSYPISVPGNYTVYFRTIGALPTACVPKIEGIVIATKTISTIISVNHILCPTDTGGIRVQVNNVPGDYQIELHTMAGALIGTYGPDPLNDYLFDNLAGGYYRVRVTTPECTEVITDIQVKAELPLQLTAVVSQNITCKEGNIQMSSSGGQTPHNYAIHSYKLKDDAFWTIINPVDYAYQSSQIFDIPTVNGAGEYRYVVVDRNLCTAVSNIVKITLELDVDYTIDTTDIACFGDSTGVISFVLNDKSKNLSYALDDGIPGNGFLDAIIAGSDPTDYDLTAFNTSGVFTNLPAGTYTLIIKRGNNSKACFYPKTVVLTEPIDPLTGTLAASQPLTCNQLGEVTVDAIGGTPPYQYAIDGINFVNTNVFTGLFSGSNTVTIIDANGCITTTNAVVFDVLNKPTDLSITTTQITCPSLSSDLTVASVIGGTLPFVYEIIAPAGAVVNNGNDPVFTNLSVGTYRIKVTDALGCSYEEDYTIIPVSEIAIVGIVDTEVICKGTATGNATFTVSGFTTSYSYSLNGNPEIIGKNSTSIVLPNLFTGNYTIVITDETTLCTDTATVTITEPVLALTMSLTASPITCNTNAAITVTANGGWGALEYQLEDAAGVVLTAYGTTKLFTNVLAGDYSVFVRDANGCVLQENITIDAVVVPTISIVASTECFTSTGNISITATGTGTAPLQYALNGGNYQNGNVFSNILPGNHSITVKDMYGCEATSNVITVFNELTLSTQFSSINGCMNTTDVTITAYGGDGVYTYTILPTGVLPTPGDYVATAIITLNAPGDYVVYVKDGKGCETFETITVLKDPPLTITASSTPILCNGDLSVITVIAGGGQAPYEYQLEDVLGAVITNYQASPVFNNLPVKDYVVRVKDARDCEVFVTVIISEPDYLLASAGVTELVSCNNDMDAEVRITNAQGGTPFPIPNLYRYSFDGGLTYTTSNISNLPSGTHTVYVQDANGCTFSMEVIVAAKITAPDYMPSLTYDCDGNGIYTVTAVDPIPLYSYTFNIDGGAAVPADITVPTYGGPTGISFPNIPVGTHTVTMNFTPLATPTKSVLLEESFGIGANTSISNIDPVYCYEPQDGTGGCFFGPAINDGEYSVTQKVAFPFGSWRNPNDHSGMVNGRFLAINVGGAAGTTGIIYEKEVKDIIPNRDITISLYAFNLLRQGSGGGDPSINVQLVDSFGTVLATSPVSPVIPKNTNADDWHEFKITLNPGANTNLSIVIRTNSAVIMGNDIAIDDIFAFQEPEQCPSTTAMTFTVEAGKEFKVMTTTVTDVTCNGGSDGSISVQVSNFDPVLGYQFSTDGGTTWSASQLANIITVNGLNAGSHAIEIAYITDGLGTRDCAKTLTEIIGEPTAVLASASIIEKLTCTNAGATITASAIGGGGSYEYQLEDTAGLPIVAFKTSPVFENLMAGSYIIRVRDVFGCEDVIDVQIDIELPTPILYTTTQTNCYTGYGNGSITVNVTAGNGNYQFGINGSAFQTPSPATGTSYTFLNLISGNYTIAIRDQFDCSVTSVVTIDSQLIGAAILVNDIDCNVPTNGEILINANGGAGGNTYEWSNDGGGIWNASNFVGNLFTIGIAGDYIFKITDASACFVITNPITLTPAINPDFTLLATDIKCNGDLSGVIDITIDVTKGLAPYTTNIINTTSATGYGTQTTGLPAGDYEVTITDAKGCSTTNLVSIIEPTAINGNISKIDISCANPFDVKGVISVDAGGTGTGPYTYQVYNNDYSFNQTIDTAVLGLTNYTFTSLDFGQYKVVIIDANGCESISDITIGTSPDILVTIVGVATCTTGSITVQANTTSGSLSTGPYYFAIYPIATPAPLGFGWFPGVAGVLASGAATEEYTFNGLTPGVTYTFVVYDDSTKCTYIQEADKLINPISTLKSTIDTITDITCTGASDGRVDFTIFNYEATATQVDYQVFQTITINPILGQSGSFIGLTGIPASDTLTGFAPGEYFIQYTEVDGGNPGCITTSEPFLIQQSPTLLEITASLTKNENCNELGIITALAQYGTAPYDYQIQAATDADPTIGTWLGGNATGIFNVVAGDYKVFVKDALNCIQGIPILLTVPLDPSPAITATADYTACPGEGNFSVNITLDTAGVPPYSIQINGGASQVITDPFDTLTPIVITGLNSGVNTFQITDSNGCSEAAADVITIVAPLEFNASITKLLDCSVAPNATITLRDVIGSGNYTYQIDNLDTATNYVLAGTVLPALPFDWNGADVSGEYEIIITDTATNCTAVKSVFIVADLNPILLTVPTTVDALCSGSNDGSIRITAQDNGIGPFTFSITAPLPIVATSNNGFTATFENLPGSVLGTNYTITITGANGCTTDQIVTIFEPTPVSIDLLTTTPFGCTIGNTPNVASITVTTVSGGNGSYTRYEFVNSDGITVQDGTNNTLNIAYDTGTAIYSVAMGATTPGLFTVNVYDSNGCLATDTETILLFDEISNANITVLEAISCVNLGEDIQIDVISTAGDPTQFEFSDDNGITWQLSNVFNDLAVGTHNFTIRHLITGCTYPLSYTVNEPNTFTPKVTIVNQVICKGSTSGTVTFELEDTTYPGGFDWEIFDTKGTLANDADDTSVATGNIGTNGPTLPVNIGAGSYYVVITQNNIPTCNNRVYFTITEPIIGLSGTYTSTNITCIGNDGTLVITPTGGWANYEYYVGVGAPGIGSWTVSDSFNGLAVATYQVWIKDMSGCEIQLPDAIFTDPVPITGTLQINNANCTGNNGEIEVVLVTGGQGTNYQYQLILNGIPIGIPQSSPVFTGLGAGNYEVEISDQWSCVSVIPAGISILFETLQPSVSIVKEIDCTAIPGGEITTSVTGGSGNYTYTITQPDATVIPSVTGIFVGLTQVGVYTITITDITTNCTAMITETLVAPSNVFIDSLNFTDAICTGDANGTITVNLAATIPGINDEPPYTYQITAPILGIAQSSNVFTGLVAGTYTVLVTSVKGCTDTKDITIGEPVALSVVAITDTFVCTPTNITGVVTIIANASDGTPGYLFSIDGLNYTASTTFEIVDTGVIQNITLWVKDANGCTATATVAINPLPTVTAIAVTQNTAISCVNPENVTVTVTGGSGDFTYELLPIGTNSQSIISQSATFDLPSVGSYTFKVIDNSTGCFVMSIPYIVAPFDTIAVTALSSTPIQCFGDTNGSITFEVLNYGGNYTWDVLDEWGLSIANNTGNGTLNPVVIPNVPGGNYTVYIVATDPAFCDATSNVITIASPSTALTVNLSVSHKETCDPGDDGEIIALGAFGWGSYEYQLSQGAVILQAFSNANVFKDLDAGMYTVTVKDAAGCEYPETIQIIAPNPMTATATPNTLSCFGDLDGEITVFANGGQGIGTYLYSLINAVGNASALQTSPVFNNLAAGTYTVLVTDNLNCEVTTLPVTIVVPDQVIAAARLTNVLSCTMDAIIEITASGGDGGPYTYSVDGVIFNGVNTFNLNPAIITTYQFFVRDASGCTSAVSNGITVRPVQPLTITIDGINANISCFGGNNAVIAAVTSGGMGNYKYELLDGNDVLLDGPQNSSIFTDLASGIYKVRVSSLDCSEISTPFAITDPKQLQLIAPASVINISCFGEEDGKITVNAVGGTGNLIYSIDQNKYVTNNVFENLGPGTYTVTVQDQNGCYINERVTIQEPALLVMTFGLINQEKCIDDKDASIEIVITGGTAPYFTKLNIDGVFVQGKLIYDNLLGGSTYAIYIEDSAGCTQNLVIKLDPPVDLNFGTTIDYACDGNIKIIASVDDEFENDVTYTLVSATQSFSNTTGVFENLTPDTYLAEAEHTNGCIPSQSFVEVVEMIPAEVTLEETFVNTITAHVTFGLPPFQYRIDGGEYRSSNEFIVKKTGTYTVEVRDARGCISTADIYIEFITVFIPNFFTPDGDGTNDYWYPRKLMAYPNIHVSVFDRYSRLIIEFRGPQVGWDGKLNGTALPSGDYWYVIDLDGLQGDKRKMMGNFTLYR
ncbi:MAG: T9SS type B sorting domain-containing protein [Flavobacteriaceae bacterium]|nr:T9SS type B sorting domain-containing protein [Flavobacteriaceae bacterium]